jgi:hypothetical protein
MKSPVFLSSAPYIPTFIEARHGVSSISFVVLGGVRHLITISFLGLGVPSS